MPKAGSRDLSPAWSSDGQQVAFIRGEAQPESSETTTVWVVGADGTNARALAAVPYAHSLEWDPDGESLLVSTKDLYHNGSLSLVDVTTGDVRKLADDATLGAWFPDGEHIVYFTKDGARQSPGWRLALARVDRRLERESCVGDVQEYPSSYFGITTACAP